MYRKGPGPGVPSSRRASACRVRGQPFPQQLLALWASPGHWEGLVVTSWPGWESCLTLGNPSSSFPPDLTSAGLNTLKPFPLPAENPKLPLCFREKLAMGTEGPRGWRTSVQLLSVTVLSVFFQRLLPDPILKLRMIIGFGGYSTRWVGSLNSFGN